MKKKFKVLYARSLQKFVIGVPFLKLERDGRKWREQFKVLYSDLFFF